MANITEKEKALIPELISIVKQLSDADKEHLFWIGQGILFASKNCNDKN